MTKGKRFSKNGNSIKENEKINNKSIVFKNEEKREKKGEVKREVAERKLINC